MKKILFITVVLIAASIGFLSANGAQDSDSITLRYQDWQLAEEPAGSTLKSIINDYNVQNEGSIIVETESVPFEQFLEKLTIQFRGGQAPNVVRVATENLSRLVEMGAIIPLDELVEAEKGDFLEPFYDNALGWATFNSNLYGIPNRIDAQALYYNRRMYEEAGLNPDKGPDTWEELEEYAKKLTIDKNGDGVIDQYGYQLIAARTGSTSGRLMRWFWDNGGNVFSEDLSHSLIDSPECVEAFEFWVGLYKKGYVPPGVTSADFSVSSTNFAQEKTAHMHSGPWTIGQTIAANPDMEGNIGIYPLPNNGTSQGGATYYVIPVGTENVKESWELIKYMTSLENQVKWTVETTLLPGRKDAADDPAIANNALLRNFFDALAYSRPIPPVPEWREIEEILWDAVQSALSDETTPQEALTIAKVKIDQILDRD